MITGYHLSLGGTLIRPHRAEELDSTDTFYSYNDNSLQVYKDYTYITKSTEIIGKKFDYIVVTLNAAPLRNEVGSSLVNTIGEAVHQQPNTNVVLGSVFIDILSWFLSTSGLAKEQVTGATLAIHAYPTKAVELPLHPPTDPKLLAKADTAYSDRLPQGFNLDDSSPAIAQGFKELCDTSGISTATINPVIASSLGLNPFFAILSVCDLVDWPTFKAFSTEAKYGEVWALGIAVLKEIQGLSIHGEVGQ